MKPQGQVQRVACKRSTINSQLPVTVCLCTTTKSGANEDSADISTGRGKVISKWNFIASSQMLPRLAIIDSIQIARFTSH